MKQLKSVSAMFAYIKTQVGDKLTIIPEFEGIPMAYEELGPYIEYTQFETPCEHPWQKGHLVMRPTIFRSLSSLDVFAKFKTTMSCMTELVRMAESDDKHLIGGLVSKCGFVFEWLPYAKYSLSGDPHRIVNDLTPLTKLPWVIAGYTCVLEGSTKESPALTLTANLHQTKHKSRLNNISWVHSNGVLTPIGDIRHKTLVDGKPMPTIELFDYNYVNRLGLYINDYILILHDELGYNQLTNIKKSKVSHSSTPYGCPTCSGKIEQIGDNIRCIEFSCVDTNMSKLLVWLTVFGEASTLTENDLYKLIVADICTIVDLLVAKKSFLATIFDNATVNTIMSMIKRIINKPVTKGHILHALVPIGYTLQECIEIDCLNYRKVKDSPGYKKLDTDRQNDLFSELRRDSCMVNEMYDLLKEVV